jgi:hypothetical protein
LKKSRLLGAVCACVFTAGFATTANAATVTDTIDYGNGDSAYYNLTIGDPGGIGIAATIYG